MRIIPIFRRIAQIVVVLILGGCAAGADRQSPRTLTDADNRKLVIVLQGQPITIRLPGNPSTGYRWTLADPLITELQPAAPPAYEPDPAAAGRVGAGGTEVFEYTAASKGRGMLRFDYRRPWEKSPPVSSVSYDIEVR